MRDRYATENLVFFDFESYSPTPINRGSYAYATDPKAAAILLAYAIGEGPIKLVDKRGEALTWHDFPEEIGEAYLSGKVFCAFNTSFDRCIWNYTVPGSPLLRPQQVIDARATALAHNLPDDLESLSTRLGGPGKQKDGKALIAMFCGANAVLPDDPDEAWDRFREYAKIDVQELRRCFRVMLPRLTDYDWATYQANEQVNDNGAGVDLEFCQRAALLADEESVRIGKRLAELTAGKIDSIHQNKRLAQYIHDRLPDTEARGIMSTVFKEESEDEDDDALVEHVKLTIARGTVERLLDYLREIECRDKVLMEVLELREFGASAAPKKFQAILDRNVDGRLHGEFQFNGGGQTGRFSGKGVQLQNLTRTVLGKDKDDDYGYWEEPTVELIARGCTLEELRLFGNGEVPVRKLALTIRPAIVAKGDRTLIKADYRQIEARVLPWLSKAAGGEQLLDSFRRSDADPHAPDLYRVTAAGMMGIKPEEVSKDDRQRGKVAVLACGYGGGRNALHSMAANYRMHFSDAAAQAIVDAWRQANPWAPAFWGRYVSRRIHGAHYPGPALHTDIVANVEEDYTESYGLFGAARRAIEKPLTPIPVGRVQFAYIPLRHGGTLLCILPSGRPLVYPSCKMRDYDVVDKITKKVLDTRHGLTFRRARGIIALYGGRFAENITQAASADLLRESITELIKRGFMVVAHSHDEITVECDRADIERTTAAIEEIMTASRPWAEGLPLAVDVSENWYYSAAKKLPA